MRFNCGIKSISISAHAKEVFEELEKIRPKHISFSLMLAIAADEYVKQHKKGLVKMDDFVTETSEKLPPKFNGNIEEWVSYIQDLDNSTFKELQTRLLQLQNISDKRCGV